MGVTCRRARAVLSRLVDQEGDCCELERAAEHVKGCERCQAEVEALGTPRRLLGQLARATVSADYDRQFAERVAGSGSAPLAPVELRSRGQWKRIAWGGAAAAAIVAVIVSGDIARSRHPRVLASYGVVEISRAGEGWRSAPTGAGLVPGDRVRVMGGAQVDLALRGRYEVRVRSQDEAVVLLLLSNGGRNADYELEEGRAVVSVSVPAHQGTFRMRTPAAVTTVMGTRFMVEVREHGRTRVAVSEGKVVVKSYAGDAAATAEGSEVIVMEGQQTEVWPKQAPHRPTSWRGLVFVGRS